MKEKIILNNVNYKGFKSPGLLGKKPIIGLVIFLLGSLIFIILAYNLVNNGSLIKWDLPLAEYFHSIALNSSPWIINIMIFGYYLGMHGIVIIAVLLALYFLYKRFWRELVMVVVSLGLSGLIFIFLSNIFNRSRPFLLFTKRVWSSSPTNPCFPSGHALSIVVCFGLLAYLILPKIRSYLGKILVIIAALTVMFYVGLSRLYIGDHYLTDIIAGYAVGFAWSGLAFTFVELLFKRYHNKTFVKVK